MKLKKLLLSTFLVALLVPALAWSDGRELAVKNIRELETLLSASIASGDLVPVYDASTRKVKAVSAVSLPLGGAFNGTVGATTPSTGVFTSIGATLAITDTRAPTADSGTTNNAFTTSFTTPVDTTGTNIHQGFNVTPTISNATGGTNSFNGFNFANVTGDAEVNVTALKIGTGTTLGTSNAITIASGWDAGITNASKSINSFAAAADSGTTNNSTAITFTYPVDTTGTNTHNLIDIALTAANATGGTNTVNGFKFENYTGDAQVNVNAINIGTSDGLGTAVGIAVGTGWDTGLSLGSPMTTTSTISGDGGDALVGFIQSQVASTTTSATLAQCGSTFVSNSADVITLPEASTALGCRYTFVCGTADDFDVNPADGTDQITSVSTTNGTTGVVTLAPAAGDAIRCTDIGGSITLEAVGANAWSQVAGGNGIWTDVN